MKTYKYKPLWERLYGPPPMSNAVVRYLWLVVLMVCLFEFAYELGHSTGMEFAFRVCDCGVYSPQ